MHVRSFVIILVLLIASTSATTLLHGCIKAVNTTTISVPVEHVYIISRPPGTVAPPPGGWGVEIGTPDPHPTAVQVTFAPGEKMALGLSISAELEQDITFSKYTFYSLQNGTEMETGSQNDLGPFEAKHVVLVAWDDPWTVPDEPGIYEVRVYLGSEVVASAVFEVRIP